MGTRNEKHREEAGLSLMCQQAGDRSTDPVGIFVDKAHARRAQAAQFLRHNRFA
jgi:hypothetical protein